MYFLLVTILHVVLHVVVVSLSMNEPFDDRAQLAKPLTGHQPVSPVDPLELVTRRVHSMLPTGPRGLVFFVLGGVPLNNGWVAG